MKSLRSGTSGQTLHRIPKIRTLDFIYIKLFILNLKTKKGVTCKCTALLENHLMCNIISAYRPERLPTDLFQLKKTCEAFSTQI